ncbi:flagellar hook-basal body complex protein FliE [Arthrobacter sp. GMC3]|uniref:flagellar hook-basal body complex protein FliE n=1 Tax=Arthrobacter sp. GMC3 TaxID=2058894 RepID=UPI000CE3DDDE|nr:flagellar hook-basal body complex protein FliE [Arthrobacter sp. GMC3]
MSLTPITGVQATTPTAFLPSVDKSAGTSSGDGFGVALTGALDNAQALSSQSKTLAVQAVTGRLDDIHNATIASTRAQVTLELIATVRNKGVDAFNEIMRMQA